MQVYPNFGCSITSPLLLIDTFITEGLLRFKIKDYNSSYVTREVVCEL